MLNIETDNNQCKWEIFEVHAVDRYHFEAEDVITKYMQNISNNVSSKTWLEVAAMGASKQFYDRETETYVDDK